MRAYFWSPDQGYKYINFSRKIHGLTFLYNKQVVLNTFIHWKCGIFFLSINILIKWETQKDTLENLDQFRHSLCLLQLTERLVNKPFSNAQMDTLRGSQIFPAHGVQSAENK